MVGSEAHDAVTHRHARGGAVIVGVRAHGGSTKAKPGVATRAVDHRKAAVWRAVSVVRPRRGLGGTAIAQQGQRCSNNYAKKELSHDPGQSVRRCTSGRRLLVWSAGR